MIYQNPDFDAPVVDTLKRGGIYDISKTKKGAFYKIRLRSGATGWISEVDIKVGAVKLARPGSEKEKQIAAKTTKPLKPFSESRYRGPTFDLVNFTENTMGKDRASNLVFYGIKFNGFDTLFDGEIYTETNFIFSSGAPSYYSSLTKKSADGFVFISDFLFQTTLPQSKWHFLYYGFGPMLKFSHFTLDVPNGTGSLKYSADDMVLGAVFDLGLAFRISRLSLRTDLKYYWERTKYLGFGVNLGWAF